MRVIYFRMSAMLIINLLIFPVMLNAQDIHLPRQPVLISPAEENPSQLFYIAV